MADAFVRSRFVTDEAAAYAAAHTTPPGDLERELRAVTQRDTNAPGMQIGDDQAVLMEVLARAMGARNAIEIGTFTGYSALAVARGLGPEGHLLCLDISEEWTSIAKGFWERAGVGDRIELRLGPALDSLRALPSGATFDLAFVDADKPGYLGYYEELVPRLRPGGLLLADNVLQGGRVYDPEAHDESAEAIRRFNDRVAADDRVQVVLLPIGDGVSVIQRRLS